MISRPFGSLVALALGLSLACAPGATQPLARASEPTGRTLEPSTADSTVPAYLVEHRRAAIGKLLAGPNPPLDSTTVLGLRYFPYDDSLRIMALFRPSVDTTLVQFPTSDGRLRNYRVYGTLILPYRGALHELAVFELPGSAGHPLYGDHLFLPFYDDTNGESSYGGGRYLDLSRRRLDASDFSVDLNLAYNPWCAYRAGYSCPVPPAATNTLGFAVEAGEAAFAKTSDAATSTR